MPLPELQRAFAANIRHPQLHAIPDGIEPRRMRIYQELVYNNLEGFIGKTFPVLRQLLADDVWHSMMRDFISRHTSSTPYFHEIAQEFLSYLQEERNVDTDPPFMLELAHYEWVELALDVSPAAVDWPVPVNSAHDLLETNLAVSPLAWLLSYRFPVHRIGPAYQPAEPAAEPVCLVVCRDRSDKVRFIESNAVTHRLLALLQNERQTGRAALLQLAAEIQYPDPDNLMAFGAGLLATLARQDIVINL